MEAAGDPAQAQWSVIVQLGSTGQITLKLPLSVAEPMRRPSAP